MSLLGFDAIGRWALGQPPASSGNAALIASAGTFALTGKAETFNVAEAGSVGAFALTGVAAAFKASQAASAGAFGFAGVAASFGVADAEAAGGVVVLLGIATVDLIGHPSPPPGGFVASGVAIPLVVTFAPNPGATTLAGFAAGFTRDYINWAKQPFAGASWSADGAPQPNWIQVAPPSNTPSSNTWTVDPAQAIPPPVSQ